MMKSLRILLSLAVASLALSLGACSRTQPVSSSVVGPDRGGDPSAVVGCPTILANTALAPDTFKVQTGFVPRFTNRILRIHVIGDVASTPNLDAIGACATGLTPGILVSGGHANVFLAGTATSISGPMTFSAMALAPGVAGELLGTDALGNSMHIIWPVIQGLGVGSPIVRVELRSWDAALITPTTRLDVKFDLTLQQGLVNHTIVGSCANIPLDGTTVNPGFVPQPCPLTLGAGGVVVNQLASMVLNSTALGIRADIIGDVAGGTIGLSGPCAASATPTIQFTGGSGNMTLTGKATSLSATGAMTFGALAFPGIALEPGVVIATDANKNKLEIIWPQVAGLGLGAPILRLQVGTWTPLAKPGTKVDVNMTFNAVGPNGLPATFTAAARGLTLPALK
mgnify:FL=1